MRKAIFRKGLIAALALAAFFLVGPRPFSALAEGEKKYDFKALEGKSGSGLLMEEETKPNEEALLMYPLGPEDNPEAPYSPADKGMNVPPVRVDETRARLASPADEKSSPDDNLARLWEKMKADDLALMGPAPHDPFMPNPLVFKALPPIGAPAPPADRKSGEAAVAPTAAAQSLRLTAVIISSKSKNAYGLLEDAEGRSYIIRPGMLLGKDNQMVASITPDRVVLEQSVRDFKGDLKINRTEIMLESSGAAQSDEHGK